MKIKVYGTPNKHAKVKVMNPVSQQKVIRRPFVFDENGEVIIDTDTLRPRIARELMRRYKYKVVDCDVEPAIEVDVAELEIGEITAETIAEPKLRHCKKCDFVCDNQGDLMRHYREQHKN